MKRTVLITGASSGIGQAVAEKLAKEWGRDCFLILMARREEKLKKLADKLKNLSGAQLYLIQADVRDLPDLTLKLNELPEEFKSIDILINNAGVALSSDPIQQYVPENWDVVIDTNIKGVLNMAHLVLPPMLQKNSGHIVNISSIAGHLNYSGGNVYCATKHAVRSLSQSIRMDLLGTAIRVTDIAPGAVHTEFSEVRWKDKQKSDSFYKQFTPLMPEDIAESVFYALSAPVHVNVAEIVIYPTHQASPHHLYKPFI